MVVLLEPSDQDLEILDEQCRMRLSRGAKVGLDAQMNLESTALEPDSAALRQMRRFRDFRNAQHFLVEIPRCGLPARRHRKLHVFDRHYWHAFTDGIAALK